MSFWDVVSKLNPFAHLAADAVGKIAADAYTAAWLSVWQAGLLVLRVALQLMDTFLVPDLSQDGPARDVYATTFWLAGTLVLVLGMVQLGLAGAKRDGRSLATLIAGVAQFGVVWAAWLTYGVTVVIAAGGITRGLMRMLLDVDTWAAWQPWKPFEADDITDAAVATVLGLLGLVLWVAAIGHFLFMLTRAAGLIVLAATTPISAAGLVGDFGKSWFWRGLRWFHAAAFSPPLAVLVLGIGTRLTGGAAEGLTDTTAQAIGTVLPGVMLIAVAMFMPLALFRLLAFVDPGTPSGAALRQGLAVQGGIQGLLGGGGAAQTSGAAASTDQLGRSSGEQGAQDATSSRFGAGLQAAGGALSAGFGIAQRIGLQAASIGGDLSSQMGVGHDSYLPDFAAMNGGRGSGGARPRRPSSDDTSSDTDGASVPTGNDDPGRGGQPTIPPGPPMPGPLAPSGGGAPGGAAGRPVPTGAPASSGGAGGAGGAAETAAVAAL